MNWNDFTHPHGNRTHDVLNRIIADMQRELEAAAFWDTNPANRSVEQICRRASQLGWTVERSQRGNLFQFTFVSPDRKRTFPGQPNANAKQALADTAIALNSFHFLDDK